MTFRIFAIHYAYICSVNPVRIKSITVQTPPPTPPIQEPPPGYPPPVNTPAPYGSPPSSMTALPPGMYAPAPYQPQPSAPRMNGCAWGCAGIGGCAALIGVAVLVLILTGITTINGLIGGIGSALGIGRGDVASVFTTQTVVTSIQPLGQLVSVSAQLAKADIYVGIESGIGNACGFGANHVAQGAVEAGIDLTQLSASDVQFDTLRNTYIITLPAAQLTSCRVEYIRQYERTTTACNVDWDEARFIANYSTLIDFRDDSLEGGILLRAEGEARDVIVNFIGLTTGANVEVNFRPAVQPTGQAGGTTTGAGALPTSCQPGTPQGWRVTANGTWTRE